MKPVPSNPMLAHQHFIKAWCEDLVAGDSECPRAKAVVEITRQVRGDLAAPTVAGGPADLSRCASQPKALIDYRKEKNSGR